MSKNPFKSTLVVSSATFISRIFGYIRDAVIFITFGANAGTDAFFVAFRIPNFLRRLFAEGAFSQAFIPVMTSHLHNTEDDFQRLNNHVTGLLAIVLFIITVIGVMTAPWLIYIFAPGFDDPQQHALASDMLKITFPYIFFISLTALFGSILNIRQRFAVPAVTPVFLNLALIGAAIFLAPRMHEPVIALAWGVFIAGVVQLAFQIPFLIQARALPKPKLSGASEGVRRVLNLMLPAIFGSSIVQINLLINTIIASFLAVGSISWLYISDRFVELPLAIFGIAIATVLLPLLSKHHVAEQYQDFDNSLQWAMKLALLISIPTMFGLIILATPIISTLVQYREFSVFDTQMASLSLKAYALGLPAFIFIKILAPGFYSRQDTKTPVKIGVVAMLVNLVFNLSFIWIWQYFQWDGAHAALALSTSLSAYINAGLLFFLLQRADVLHLKLDWLLLVLKVTAASVLMLLLLVYFAPNTELWSEWNTHIRFGSLLGLISLGLFTYLSVLLLFGLRPSQFRMQS